MKISGMNEADRTVRMGRWSRSLLGLILSAFFLVGIVWAVPFSDVKDSLMQANHGLLVLASLPVLLNLWIRGIRWALLFQPQYSIQSRDALGPVLIGLALNSVLPGRAGELARVGLGARKLGVSVPFVLSTVFGERLLDAVVLLFFLGISLLLLPQVEGSATVEFMGFFLSFETLGEVARNLGIASALLSVLVVSLLVPFSRSRLKEAFGKLPLVGVSAKKALGELGRGLTSLRRPMIFLKVLSLSLILWFALALTILLVSKAIPGIDLNLRQALVIMSISIAVSAIPSAPGAWGVFEAGILLALTLCNVSLEKGTSIAFAFVAHTCQYLPVVSLGGVAAILFRFARNKTDG